jgi:hypothetical protein
MTGALMELAKVEKDAEFPEHYHTSARHCFLFHGNYAAEIQ